LSLFEYTSTAITKLPQTTFAERSIGERADLQRLLKLDVSIIAPGLLVIAEEFCDWEDSRRRIDLLAIDEEAKLVVIELKRTEDGGHMDLQAIRYAAMISQMTFPQAVSAFAKYRQSSTDQAQSELLKFLEWEAPKETDFAKEVRIVLVSAEFSKEVTTTVMWLNNTHGLDLTCIRMRPYLLDGRTLLDVQTIIPLPEADDYLEKVKEKAEEEKLARTSTSRGSTYSLTIDGQIKCGLTKRALAYEVVQAVLARGITVEDITKNCGLRQRWVSVAGEVTAAEFIAKVADSDHRWTKDPEGFYFCKEGELFRIAGKTYALTNQWDESRLRILDGLIALVPNAAIKYEKEVES